MPAVPPSAPTEVEALFGRIAPVYDSFNFWLSLGQHQVWKAMTVDWSACQQGNRVLDVCCGTGDLTRRLAKQVGRAGQVVGLDFCSELLALAAQRQRQTYPHYSVQWLQGNALALPFADQSFDGATMGYGLRNVGNIPLALAELQRVLKVGKNVAILDFNHPRSPGMKSFQNWYLNHIVLAVADYFQVPEEYAYIQTSLDRFPPGHEQVKMAYNAGFSRVVHYEIAGGLMGVLVAQK
jgi:demethylmenaquinone methyltransferase/2-methoxy-6-polyprenyl-1,4-benzoquinol methylase